MYRPIIISCYFGKNPQTIYTAPKNYISFFISNAKHIEQQCQKKGWIFIYAKNIVQSECILTSSLQSKFVKFMKFLPAKLYGHRFIYFDQSLEIKDEHIKHILATSIPKKTIYVFRTPKLKENIYDEILDAMKQPRYALNMAKTIRWINKKIVKNDFRLNKRITRTGLMQIIADPRSVRFLNKICNNCVKQSQPECQIIWGILSQKRSHMIQESEWDSLQPPPIWKKPKITEVPIKSELSNLPDCAKSLQPYIVEWVANISDGMPISLSQGLDQIDLKANNHTSIEEQRLDGYLNCIEELTRVGLLDDAIKIADDAIKSQICSPKLLEKAKYLHAHTETDL